MSRNLSADMLAALIAANVRPILLYEAEFVSGTVRYWTGYGDLSWNSQTWTGTGTLITMSAVDENDDVRAQGATLKLAGMPEAMIAIALAESRSGKPGSVRFGLLSEAGAVIATPKVTFKGRLDDVEIDDENPQELYINFKYEHELIDLERPREWRYTDEHQQQLYPGDTGLRYIPGLQDKELTWGRR